MIRSRKSTRLIIHLRNEFQQLSDSPAVIFSLLLFCYSILVGGFSLSLSFLATVIFRQFFYVSFFSRAFGSDSEHVTESLLLTLSGMSAFVGHIDLFFTPR